MPYVLNEQLNEFVSAVRASLGKSIKSVILYGSYVIKNIDSFEYWSDTLPFYRNVKMEGVKVA